MTRDELTLKAISTYNGNLHNGLTTALEAVVAMVLREAAAECMAELPGEGGPMEEGYRLACEENARNVLKMQESSDDQ